MARALSELAAGGSYAEVSRWALRADELAARRYAELVAAGLPADAAALGAASDGDAGTAVVPANRRRRRKSTSPAKGGGGEERPERKTKNPRSRESHNVWHIAADWCEAFAPVVYGPVEAPLREAAFAERARLDAVVTAGGAVDRPQVLLLDDIPVYGRDTSKGGKSRRDEGFFLLVAAEMTWSDPDPFEPNQTPQGVMRLRLVRAMAKSNAHAWRLVFDELGYTPDFVVADAGTGIARAVELHFGSATTLVPSLWHVGQAVRTGLTETRGAQVATDAGKVLNPTLEEHLRALSRSKALVDAASWKGWWDTLEGHCVTLRLPRDRVKTRRRNYESAFIRAIPKLAAHPQVPVSTGGLETLMAKWVQPLLSLRRTGFANLERTNRLFDLVVARANGAFDDLGDVVTLLRQDAITADGWTVPLRDVADPRPVKGRYSSLRDATLLAELAQTKGLA